MNLLKFRALRLNDMKYAMEIAELNRLFLARPSTLNDPFDCAMPNTVTPEGALQAARFSMGLHREKLRRIVEAAGDVFDEEKLVVQGAEGVVDDFEKGVAQKRIEAMVDAGFRILSLSNAAASKSILMWSHYADSHKGVCLEFDDAEFIRAPRRYEVDYEDNAAPIEFFSADQEERIRMLVTKASVWRYEGEYRFVLPVFRPTLDDLHVTFKPAALRIVRFGVGVDPDARDQFIKVCRRRRPVPVFIEMKKSGDGLRLEEQVMPQMT